MVVISQGISYLTLASRFNVKLLKVGSGRSRGRKVGGNLLRRQDQVRIVIPPDSKDPGYNMDIKWI